MYVCMYVAFVSEVPAHDGRGHHHEVHVAEEVGDPVEVREEEERRPAPDPGRLPDFAPHPHHRPPPIIAHLLDLAHLLDKGHADDGGDPEREVAGPEACDPCADEEDLIYHTMIYGHIVIQLL